jgi:pyruvate formate lyase activating enzyme
MKLSGATNMLKRSSREEDVKPAENTRGFVFNIQHYSIHDGPGIRTTVFTKGCPLSCVWCQNPESQSKAPQLFFTSEKCTGCGACAAVCPEKAITMADGKSKTNRLLCKGAGKCTEVCPNEARNLMGKKMSAAEVFKDVNADAVFYQRSGGGVTISGGEPLAQPDFTLAILKLCKAAGLATALDTSGYAGWDVFKDVLPYVNAVLYDFKHLDPGAHRKLTGVSNELILENAGRIIREFPDIALIARIPVVPGCNDANENISRTARFIKEPGKPVKVYLLLYHRLGEIKYERLEKPGTHKIDLPTEAHVAELRRLVESCGLECAIGG